MSEPASEWRAEVYTWAWLMGMDGDISIGDRSASVSASFADVLDASDALFAPSGPVEVGRGRIDGFLDGMHANVRADDQTGPLGVADVDVKCEMAVVDGGLTYCLLEKESTGAAAADRHRLSLDAYAGGRYLWSCSKLEPAHADSRSSGQEWVDPIVGAKLVIPIHERWSVSINGDVGGFGVESDLTWLATGVVGYDLALFKHPSTVFLGYRGIAWDHSSGAGSDEMVLDITLHGPIIGLSLKF